MKHVKITVRGKVQGVYFRETTKNKAREMGIAGFVRNEPDGSVYIEAEADDDVIQAFIQWCHEGSPEAVVESVDISEHPPNGHNGFDRK